MYNPNYNLQYYVQENLKKLLLFIHNILIPFSYWLISHG